MDGLDLEIRRRLADYLAGQNTIAEFREWFQPRAWNSHLLEERHAVEMIQEIDLVLAEFEHGDWTESEVRERFRPFVTWYTVNVGQPRTLVASSSEQVTWRQLLASAGGSALGSMIHIGPAVVVRR